MNLSQDALEAAGYAIKRVGGEGDAKESAARKSDELWSCKTAASKQQYGWLLLQFAEEWPLDA